MNPPAIDHQELTRLLALKGYSAPFDRMQFDLMGRFSTDVWQLKLEGKQAHELPVLVVKNPYRRYRTAESANLETSVYEEILSGLPVLTPEFIGRIDDILILEKIADLEPFQFKLGPGPGHAELAMRGYAAVHGAMWDKTANLPWLPRLSDAAVRLAFQSDFDRGWSNNRELLRKICPEFTQIGDALIGKLADTLEQLGRPAALLHGDGHAENIPKTKGGEVVFLDWQAPRVGNPGFDIAVFMAMSYPIEARRRTEQELVRLHSETIRSSGIDWPDPLHDYRLGLLRRAARIVEISADDWFSSFRWVYQRCATAAVDHQVAELIK